LLAM